MKTVRQGDRGPSVQEVQRLLNVHGFGPVEVDGQFGAGTERAVRQFQAANGLVEDGEVGRATWAELQVLERAGSPPDVLAEGRLQLTAIVGRQALAGPQQAVLLTAINDFGKREIPEGSNAGPEIAHLVDGYREYWKMGPGPGLPWCAMAVSNWIRTATNAPDWKSTPMGAFFGGVEQYREWAARRSRLYHLRNTGNIAWAPGSLFIMGRENSGSDAGESTTAGHIGLVLEDLGPSIRTIEGNVGSRVDSRTRKKHTLMGWIRWW